MPDIIKSLGATVIIAVGPGRKIPIVRDRTHEHPLWKFPGGHIKEGEFPADCAIRELWEETGLALRERANYLFPIYKRGHNLYVYYGELHSWEGLGKGTEGEEVSLVSSGEIFQMSDFLRDHHIILERAQHILRVQGVKI